jgi:hypothetical protein
MSTCSGAGCPPGRCRKDRRPLDPDVKALGRALMWIERSTSARMKRATAEFIYDRYVRNGRP